MAPVALDLDVLAGEVRRDGSAGCRPGSGRPWAECYRGGAGRGLEGPAAMSCRGVTTPDPASRQHRARKVTAGQRSPLRLRRSALRADSPAVLGLRSRRITRYVRCAHCAQTDAASQKWKRALQRAPTAALRSSAPQSRCAAARPCLCEAATLQNRQARAGISFSVSRYLRRIALRICPEATCATTMDVAKPIEQDIAPQEICSEEAQFLRCISSGRSSPRLLL